MAYCYFPFAKLAKLAKLAKRASTWFSTEGHWKMFNDLSTCRFLPFIPRVVTQSLDISFSFLIFRRELFYLFFIRAN